MPLTGTFSRNIDDKRRIAIPKRLRDEFGSDEKVASLYVAPGTDKSLSLYSHTEFENLAARMAEKSTNRADIRNYLRLFYSRAERVDLDGQGRIRIPDRLAEFAQLKREAVLLGVQDHAEIWDAAVWDEFLTDQVSDFDKMAEQAFE
ncbi:MAG: division/cell wall cluster transcriptional repressor MraZ [Planctomycetaceae bacterium]|nr:division/cell wall cluster transcriptional repressor MraZ [Planctomycetaceae bacterium]